MSVLYLYDEKLNWGYEKCVLESKKYSIAECLTGLSYYFPKYILLVP